MRIRDIVSAEETEVFLDDAFAPLKRLMPPDAYMLPVLEAARRSALQQARAAYFQTMELSWASRSSAGCCWTKTPRELI